MASYAYILLAYLVGSIPVGVLLSRMKGKDPRKVGSGNIGATNVMRAAGKTMGIITLLGDTLKGFIPTMLAIYGNEPKVFVAAIGFAAFIGHLFPVYLWFRGGKGVATALGVYLAMSPLAILINFVVFLLILLKWRYVSLGSLVAAAAMPLLLYLLKAPPEYVYLSLVIAVLTFVKHKDNIKRLLTGTEHKMQRTAVGGQGRATS